MRTRTRRSISSRIGRTSATSSPAGSSSSQFLVAFAGEDRAGVAAAHGDHHVGGADDLVGPRLGELAGDVDARVRPSPRPPIGLTRSAGFGATGPADRAVPSEMLEEAQRHLGAAGVVHAQEQHDWACRRREGPRPWPTRDRRWRANRSAISGRNLRDGRPVGELVVTRNAGTVRSSRCRRRRRTRWPVGSRRCATPATRPWRSVFQVGGYSVGGAHVRLLRGDSMDRVGIGRAGEVAASRSTRRVMSAYAVSNASSVSTRTGSGIDQCSRSSVGGQFLVGVVADRDDQVAGGAAPGRSPAGAGPAEPQPVPAAGRGRPRVHPGGGMGAGRRGRDRADRVPPRPPPTASGPSWRCTRTPPAAPVRQLDPPASPARAAAPTTGSSRRSCT